MTGFALPRPSASVFVEEAGDIGAPDRADAEIAERGQDGAVEVAHDGTPRGRLPRGRGALVFRSELCSAGPEAERPGPRAVELGAEHEA